MNIFITGGCGYKGSVLIPELLEDGHKVTNLDNQWFGNYLKPHPNLKLIKGDIREIEKLSFKDFEVIIHLANIANDPAVELNPNLSWEINVLASYKIIDKAVREGVKQFIYASSGSVYGIKAETNVTEDLPLIPISTYNKTKMIAERVFLSFDKKIKVHNIRPATVCGISPRMRLDVSVNLLTFQALKNKKINVFGGNQTRPNIHIKDMINVYKHFIKNPNIDNGNYNSGFENISILDIAKIIQKKTNAEINILESNDPRSYRQDSTKLLKTGFKQLYGVEDAIDEIIQKFTSGKLQEKKNFYTVSWMKSLKLDLI